MLTCQNELVLFNSQRTHLCIISLHVFRGFILSRHRQGVYGCYSAPQHASGNLYINTLKENLFSPLRSQIIVVFYDRLHVHCTSSPSFISSISQHFFSRTDESENFLFENGNRRRSKCIGDQSARSSSRRHHWLCQRSLTARLCTESQCVLQ